MSCWVDGNYGCFQRYPRAFPLVYSVVGMSSVDVTLGIAFKRLTTPYPQWHWRARANLFCAKFHSPECVKYELVLLFFFVNRHLPCSKEAMGCCRITSHGHVSLAIKKMVVKKCVKNGDKRHKWKNRFDTDSSDTKSVHLTSRFTCWTQRQREARFLTSLPKTAAHYNSINRTRHSIAVVKWRREPDQPWNRTSPRSW